MDSIKNNRLEKIIKILQNAKSPVSGTTLAKTFEVSRQVIVQDISLLRAQDVPIASTNRGYYFVTSERHKRIFKVNHKDEDIERELHMIVDMGGTVEDVFVCHRVYGTIRADMNIKSRKDVAEFLKDIKNSVSSPLMHVTNDYHFHTVSADDEETLDIIENLLDREGLLVHE